MSDKKMTNTVFTITTYKLKDGTVVFDYPEYLIAEEPFIKGSDDLINYLTNNYDQAKIEFSTSPIENANAILNYNRTESDGDYYIDQLSNIDCYLCPVLYEFFESRPDRLFAKVI